jgi:transposase
MRGTDHQQSHMFSYLSPEARVRKDHPLRVVRTMVDEVLRALSPQFDRMYASEGRPSIAPEKLLRAQLLQMLYSVRSERLLMEEIDYSMLFRWFVGLNLDEEVWDPTVFTKNRDRLLEAAVAKQFLGQVVEQARAKGLTSDEHFTVDGTLLEAWAGAKSFQRKDGTNPPPSDDPGNPTVNFHGEKRSNQTHASKTDPEAKLARKGEGKEAKLSYSGNLLVENRNGLIVNAMVWEASGTAERDTALAMLEQLAGTKRVTVAATKALTPPTSSANVASTGGRRVMQATASAKRNGSESRNVSAGSRPLPCCGRYDIAGCAKWIGCSPSPAPLITWSACATCQYEGRKPRPKCV